MRLEERSMGSKGERMETNGSLPRNRKELLDYAEASYDPSLARIDRPMARSVEIPVEELRAIGDLSPKGSNFSDGKSMEYFALLNSINYMFWERADRGDGKTEVVRYSNKTKVGAAAMIAGFEEFWKSGTRNPTESDVEFFFGRIPGMAGRAEILSSMMEDRNSLRDFCEGLAEKAAMSGRVSVEMASELAKRFPRAYWDPFLKRAQLALAMHAGASAARGKKLDLSDLTAFADYQVPRLLRAMGLISYSKELSAKVDGLELIEAGSREELAIRSATILACAELANARGVSEADVDNFLWLNRDAAGAEPFHLTITEAY